MKYNYLRGKILKHPIFTFEDIFKYFPKEKQVTIKSQLSRWVKRGYLKKIKREHFILAETEINDEFSLTPFIYSPSYVSLETALNNYGIIPDIPFSITAITTKKTKTFKTPFGLFNFRHVNPKLFFGFENVGKKPFVYQVAYPEKALLDYLYLYPNISNHNSFPKDYRLDLEDLNWTRLKSFTRVFKNKKISKAVKILINYHAQ